MVHSQTKIYTYTFLISEAETFFVTPKIEYKSGSAMFSDERITRERHVVLIGSPFCVLHHFQKVMIYSVS